MERERGENTTNLGGGVLLVLAGLELERFFGNGPLPQPHALSK